MNYPLWVIVAVMRVAGHPDSRPRFCVELVTDYLDEAVRVQEGRGWPDGQNAVMLIRVNDDENAATVLFHGHHMETIRYIEGDWPSNDRRLRRVVSNAVNDYLRSTVSKATSNCLKLEERP